ncbi:MAG: hypothetical protein ACE5OQ_01445 [Woeseia sp.]
MLPKALSSFEDLARDGLAGIAALEEIDGIRADMLGFVGLSQGGHIAPLTASMGDVQFVIDMVGGALPMKDMLFHELEQTYQDSMNILLIVTERPASSALKRQRPGPRFVTMSTGHSGD